MKYQEIIEREKLTMTAIFVPLSQSRNASTGWQSLNWKVTIARKGRPFLTTDYAQGAGLAPANKDRRYLGQRHVMARALALQCESGMQLHKSVFFDEPRASTKPIDPPSIVDVLYSLCSDSDVLEYASFAEWCSDFGYDTDSRKAKDIYDQCLSIALNMRGTLGDSVLSELRESFQDY